MTSQLLNQIFETASTTAPHPPSPLFVSQPLSRLPTSTNSELEAASAQLDAASAKLEAATAQTETARAIQRLAQKLYAVGRGDEYFAALDDPALMDKLLAEFGEA